MAGAIFRQDRDNAKTAHAAAKLQRHGLSPREAQIEDSFHDTDLLSRSRWHRVGGAGAGDPADRPWHPGRRGPHLAAARRSLEDPGRRHRPLSPAGVGQPAGRPCARPGRAGRRLRPAARARSAAHDADRQRAAAGAAAARGAQHPRRLSPHAQAAGLQVVPRASADAAALAPLRQGAGGERIRPPLLQPLLRPGRDLRERHRLRQVPARAQHRHARPDPLDLLGPLVAQQAHRRGDRCGRAGAWTRASRSTC